MAEITYQTEIACAYDRLSCLRLQEKSVETLELAPRQEAWRRKMFSSR